jgi:hypothetical protein
VRKLLTEDPRLRDDDILLRLHVCREMGYDPSVITYKKALALEFEGKIPNSESIRRSRAKLQHDDPSLRGKLWDERHKIEEPQWRAECREFSGPDLTEA